MTGILFLLIFVLLNNAEVPGRGGVGGIAGGHERRHREAVLRREPGVHEPQIIWSTASIGGLVRRSPPKGSRNRDGSIMR